MPAPPYFRTSYKGSTVPGTVHLLPLATLPNNSGLSVANRRKERERGTFAFQRYSPVSYAVSYAVAVQPGPGIYLTV